MFYNGVICSELQKMKPQAKTEKRDIVYDTNFDRPGSSGEKMVVPFYGNLFPDLRNMPDHHPETEETRTGRQGKP